MRAMHVPDHRARDDRCARGTGTLEQAVALAADLAEAGDTVLLAPGCASFDQFESYAARGDRFVQLVNEIMEKETAG